LLVGVSSGANVLGAVETALKLGPGHTVVTVLPDRGERYLSLAV
jgi:cysteine synthase A